MISKRKLRFVQMTPLLALCEYCNTQFSGSEEDIRQQFQSHKCEHQNSGQDDVHILGKTTPNE